MGFKIFSAFPKICITGAGLCAGLRSAKTLYITLLRPIHPFVTLLPPRHPELVSGSHNGKLNEIWTLLHEDSKMPKPAYHV